ncbi:MAG: 16S rRNA (cytidine(1402)-2'-O)-methyltransferase [Deinococcales bacterium]
MTERVVYLVPTPIGNLGDITLRALETLKSVDCIACEDTRHSAKLLAHFAISKPLERLDAHTMLERGRAVLEKYPRVAFISDAGSPGLSDPGAELVGLALEIGIRIEALPGATALIPALTLSGLPTRRFAFHGFLPRSGKERQTRLEEIANANLTCAIYESPHRLHQTLLELIELCAIDRCCAVARELSKFHEEIFRGTLQQAAAHFSGEVRGEIVLLLAPNMHPIESVIDYQQKASEFAQAGLRAKEIRQKLQQFGLERNEAYHLAIQAIEKLT